MDPGRVMAAAKSAEYERLQDYVNELEQQVGQLRASLEENTRIFKLIAQSDGVGASGGAVQGGHGSLPDASGSGSPKSAHNDGSLRCGFCGQEPEAHGDSNAGPMSVCPDQSDGSGAPS